MPAPMIGGHVTGPVLIARSDRLVVAVRHVVAFPAGVEVEVEAHSRRRGPGSDDATGFPGLRFRVGVGGIEQDVLNWRGGGLQPYL